MSDITDLTEAFRTAITKEIIDNDFDRIESRYCSNDQYDGIEYKFYGNFIPLRPIFDVVAEREYQAIDECCFANEAGEAKLLVFVVDLRANQHGHRAFTPQ